MNMQPDVAQPSAPEQPQYRKVSENKLKRIRADHRKWLETKGEEGIRADLRGADLQGASFKGADLQKASFKGANLQKANFRGANLQGAYLWDANLKEADLSGAILQGTELGGADLQGADVQRADLSGANLIAANLIDAKLQGADLTNAVLFDANLQGVKLYKACLERAILSNAKLQGADLRRADLQHADLQVTTFEQRIATEGGELGEDLKAADLTDADLRNAFLNDAKLSDVTGLIADKLAGADLSNAKLPDEIAKFVGVDHVEKISKHARTNFLAIVGGCAFSWLTIAQTTDVALLTGSSATPLPIIQTPVPIAGFYWAAPAILLTLYLYLHLYLQRMWDGLANLPAIFPDGRSLDQRAYPWLLSGLVSAYVPLLREHRPPYWQLQVVLSIVGAWLLVPSTLFLFWGRYLPRHDWPGTLWQGAFMIITIAIGLASFRQAVATLRGKHRTDRSSKVADAALIWKTAFRAIRSYRRERLVILVTTLTILLSLGAIEGSPQPSTSDLRRWLPSPYWLVSYHTFADLEGVEISTKPEDWWKAGKKQIEALTGIKGANLNGRNLRYAAADRAFLAKADLRSANLQRANLRNANLQEADLGGAALQGADLREANLQEARLRKARLQGAYLRHANLQDANLWRANLQEVDLTEVENLTQAQLDVACGDEKTRLRQGLWIRLCLEQAELTKILKEGKPADLHRRHMFDANLQGADLSGANLREARFIGGDFEEANLQGAILHSANLQEANLNNANLQGADLSSANLDGAKEITQSQLGQACGDEKTKLPEGLTIEKCR